MNLFSATQLINSGCRVILDADSCSIQDSHTKVLVGAGARRHDSQGLWELDWLCVPSSTTTPTRSRVVFAFAPFQQWLIDSVIYVGLIYHP